MPDDPISTTPNIGLGQWAERANPGAEALNENWEKTDTAIGGLEAGLSGKASQASVDSIGTRVDDLESVEDENVKRDGSVAMTGDLNLDGSKVVGLGNASDPTDAVTLQQLEAAVAAGLGALGTYKYCRAHNSANLATGTSPRTFEADVDDSDADDMHDTASNKDRFVAPADGYYLLVSRLKVVGFDGCGIQWQKNGAEASEGVHPQFFEAQGQNTTFITDVLLIPLDEGDYVSLKVYGTVEPDSAYIAQSSSVEMFLLAPNAPGGGDLKSDGTVPMVADFDNGGNKQTNLANGVAADHGATVGQMNAADQDLQDQIDDIEAGLITLEAPEVEVTSGNFVFGPSWSEFTASRLDFPLSGSRKVVLEADATAGPNFIAQCDAQIGIRVQQMVGGNPSGSPVDYYGTFVSLGPFGFGMIAGIRCSKRVTLAAGDWRVSIICRKPGGAANSSFIFATADVPARIGATYMG
jgi:hypothetical protein